MEILPETIDKIDPERKIDILLKLLPYVLSKVETVDMTIGEPFSIDF